MLIARIYEVFPLLCLICGGQMRLIAFITYSVDIRQMQAIAAWNVDTIDIGKTIHPRPTLGESIGTAAEVAHGSCTDVPPAKK